jgi:hypothetical protein
VNPALPCDAATAGAVGASWLMSRLTPAGFYGRRALDRRTPFRPGEEPQARARAERIVALAEQNDERALEAAAAALASAPDIGSLTARAQLGETLADYDFLQLLRFGDAVARADGALPSLRSPIGNEALQTLRGALERSRTEGRGFALAGEGHGEAARLRADLLRAQKDFDALRRRTLSQVAAALGRSDIADDEFVVMREGVRGSLPAVVVVLREAPTYWLCRVAYGEEERQLLERRDAAAQRLAASEDRERAALSRAVSESSAGLSAAADALGDVELLVAAARFAKRYDCRPATLVERPHLTFAAARFPPLEDALHEEGRRFVPLDLALDGAAVLTGPNMGGKSVALRTCGFVALCAALGLPVPAQRAETALFDDIAWIGTPDEGAAGGLLSSFAREVLRAREVLSRGGRQLVLVDEFARTTAPHEGAALLSALLARLQRDGKIALAATHLDGIAAAAGVAHFAVRGLRGAVPAAAGADVHAALAALAAGMDYSIEAVGEGGTGRSDAIELAQLLGLDGDLVADARRRAARSTE